MSKVIERISARDLARAIATGGIKINRMTPPAAPARDQDPAGPAPSPRPATHVGTPAELGRLIRQAREAMDLTQAQFADMAGVGRRFVSELENGKATLELGKVMAACAAAGLDLLAVTR
ncbi:hypothetical protein CFHF_15085 [Caulobacter flavus]|uniref:HTH cro/C1-type domain-containing protein n=1 Tax=Caulobacter flavus TaxID=1679497 RepID=A0A2N5CS59_9CAUL|nr:hypothetical protein C1707_09400 [Caulobacter flavus]PLR12827.1 hypothetical protein CFHF_15085 [Caulobacter flavus]